MIEFKNVSKHFGPTQVLHNIDLNIAQGEVVVIIGPSGSGKSTLINDTLFPIAQTALNGATLA